ncbi:MAG: F0F1 ATP synthase subunit A [Planctomycetota bacterium]|nr:F0F1 ATP synthase subunit A [Planctomycetota bacterium]MDI6788065.1 F0F1 ATP synthase subunit A [Planctomycetota bacterium]
MAAEHHPPTLVTPIYRRLSESNLLPEFLKGENGETYFQIIVFSWLVMGFLIIISYLSTRRLHKTPERLQSLAEVIVDFLAGLMDSFIGQGGRKYLGLLGTAFLFILFLNILGLIPGMISPTANWNCTVSMAIVVIIMVQAYGMREHGLWGYLKHHAGSPKELVTWIIAPLIFPLHMLGEMVRTMSLSLRLYLNIFGEDSIILSLVDLGFPLLPLQMVMYGFAAFTSVLQAFIFTALSSIYIMLMTAHSE